MGNLNIGAALNTVTTLVSLPVDKGTIYAELSGPSAISLSDTMMIGQNLTVIIKPTANFTLPIPSSGSWASTCGTSLALNKDENCYIIVTCTDDGKYTISSPTHGLNEKISNVSTGLFGDFSIFAVLSGGSMMIAYDMASGNTINNSTPNIPMGNRVAIKIATVGNKVQKIGNFFNSCTLLQSVTIPNSVTTIINNAFTNCYRLKSIDIPNSVTEIQASAFYGCSGLTSIVIPDSVASIGDSAFATCGGLISVTIGNGVKSIGMNAFLQCSELTSVTLGSGLTSIGQTAFNYCSKLASVTYQGITYTSKSALETALQNNGCSIGVSAFYNTSLGT